MCIPRVNQLRQNLPIQNTMPEACPEELMHAKPVI